MFAFLKKLYKDFIDYRKDIAELDYLDYKFEEDDSLAYRKEVAAEPAWWKSFFYWSALFRALIWSIGWTFFIFLCLEW